MKAIVTGGIALVGAATLLSYLDGLSWVFELATFFRLQYAVVLLAAAAAALVFRHFRAAAAGLALCAVNVGAIAAIWSPLPQPALESPARLRMLLVNLEVGNDRYDRLAELVREVRPDVVGLTELSPEWANRLEPALAGFREHEVALRPDAYGIGLYSRLPLEQARIVHLPREDGPPSVIATLKLDGRPVTLVVTHVHTPFAGDVHGRQFAALAEARAGLGDRVAICGDFNAVPWSKPFRDLISSAGLVDTHRGHGVDGSWPTWSSLLGVPIDNCLISDGLAVLERRHGPDVGSDHFPLIVELGIARLNAASGGSDP